jgi:hypothetical protein
LRWLRELQFQEEAGVRRGQFGNPEERGISFVGSRYKATASEDLVDLMCAVVTGCLEFVIH